MKKLTVVLAALCCQMSLAQDQTYLLFEFMKVDNEQEASYSETENFWEKIHQQRVQSGEMVGWDLWSLQPGGEDQHFQYLTVHVYNDPVKMMEGPTFDGLISSAKKAYPDMTEDQILEKLNHSSKTRDLAVRLYMRLIETTEDDFEMEVGTVCRVNFMKANAGQNANYEKFESEVWKPLAQQMVTSGDLGSWGLAQIIVPGGSDRYTSHITFDMFNDYSQVFKQSSFNFADLPEEQQKALQEGMATRELKWASMATLIKKVRSSETSASN